MKKITSILILVMVAISMLGGSSSATGNPAFQTGELFFGAGTYFSLDVDDISNIQVTSSIPQYYLPNWVGFSNGITFDAAGNLYAGYDDRLTVYDSHYNMIGRVIIDDPINERLFGLVMRRPGQAIACNPATPYARLFVFDVTDPHNPILSNIVGNIPGTLNGQCRNIAFDAQGQLWLTAYGTLIRLTLDDAGNITGSQLYGTGGPSVAYQSQGGSYNPNDVAFQPGTGRLIFGAVNDNMVVVTDPANPLQSYGKISNICNSGDNSPWNIAFNSAGDLFVSCSGPDLSVYSSNTIANLSGMVDSSSVRVAHIDVDYRGYLAFRPASNTQPAVGVIAAPTSPINTGVSFAASAPFTDVNTGDTHSALWNWGDGTTTIGSVQEASGSGTVSGNHSYAVPGSYTISVTVTDNHNAFGVSPTATVVVNAPPIVGAVTAPVEPVNIVGSINTSAPFTDANAHDTHVATWNWGDGTTSIGSVQELGGSGTATGSHIYSMPGVYTVGVSVADNHNASDTARYEYVVVYDTDGGFVTGGGWINSPAGAYRPNPALTGRANFGFVARYRHGQQVPDGNTQFSFQVGNLNFHSVAYEWLVVSGPRAQYRGTGRINNGGNYGFTLTVKDGQANGGGGLDKFRIKIWDRDNNNALVYDNQLNDPESADPTTVINGGSITIHR